ncbi:EAL domain-containing protein [Mycobacterium sp. 1164985.4]|uniref:EAL domain-containing protein n=1 Tax=Mycobacterium sp. 1164985.4 TaxID=1834069 RepID=UPI0007FD6F36|nr:EAL domain-containing protein [Mycobacterium sp. 1164985.4]OBK81696.1 hypothetical protein A5650_25180 [Mycobacterium sp. 1164985.4]
MQALADLRQALDRRELTLFYQPKFDAHTTVIVGVEALLRWRHPGRGLLNPEEFLPSVREYELMDRITDLAVSSALDDAKRWYSAGIQVPVAVNFFAPLLADPNLPHRTCQALADRDLTASALTIEITEGLLVDDTERSRGVLNELVAQGVRIAVDDFGTGYSALSYLADLPLHEIKLDHDFVARAIISKRAAIVVNAITDLSHKLGLITVAEGIENAASAAYLRDLGCDVLQGYFLSPPLTADEMFGLLMAPPRLRY